MKLNSTKDRAQLQQVYQAFHISTPLATRALEVLESVSTIINDSPENNNSQYGEQHEQHKHGSRR